MSYTSLYIYMENYVYLTMLQLFALKYCLKTTKESLSIFKKKSGKQQGLTELTVNT